MRQERKEEGKRREEKRDEREGRRGEREANSDEKRNGSKKKTGDTQGERGEKMTGQGAPEKKRQEEQKTDYMTQLYILSTQYMDCDHVRCAAALHNDICIKKRVLTTRCRFRYEIQNTDLDIKHNKQREKLSRQKGGYYRVEVQVTNRQQKTEKRPQHHERCLQALLPRSADYLRLPSAQERHYHLQDRSL